MTVTLGDEFGPVLAAAQGGEDWAVARLYRSLQPGILRYISAREPHDAEDIASQVWLEVARGLARFDGGEEEFRAFVFTVARRRLSNARRSRFRRRTDLVPLAEHVGPAPSIDDPAAEVAAMIDGDAAVRRITEILPADQAEIVLLRVVGDLSVEEVARIVGKRPATVRVAQHRALRKLARTLPRPATT
jgi:RNA polymerase sigma-70 factor (ECF subfamily)